MKWEKIKRACLGLQTVQLADSRGAITTLSTGLQKFRYVKIIWTIYTENSNSVNLMEMVMEDTKLT